MDSSLYADLVESPEQTELNQLKAELDEERAQVNRLRIELEATLTKLAEKEDELEVVKKNVSAIYHTAKKEIQRKDNMIADLRRQLTDASTGPASNSHLGS